MSEMTQTSSGIQELINQIHEEGVLAGRLSAEKLVREAKEQAAIIRQKAEKETQAMRAKASQDIAAEKTASIEALQLAARDTILRLGREVMEVFEAHIKRLVSAELNDENVLYDMILAMAGKNALQVSADRGADILLSEKLGEDRLRQFILKLTSGMLQDGIEIKTAAEDFEGIRIQMKNKDLEIDMTEKAITDFLVQNLLPRYRKIVRGLE